MMKIGGAAAKVKAALGLLGTAVTRPRLAVLALRERGLGYLVSEFFGASPARIGEMVGGLKYRALPNTVESIGTAFGDDVRQVSDADDLHFEIALKTGERFLIRKARCLSDMHIIWETFIAGVYADHPPVDGKPVLDIGGYLGDTAVYFAMRGARVTAYEPSAEMHELAERNVALNGVRVDLVNAGVGCRNETLQLAISETGADGMSNTLFPGFKPFNKSHVYTTPVRIVRFSEVLARFDSVFLAKIDCKDCEYPALLPLEPSELRKIEHIILQYSRDPAPLIEKFQACGFAVRLPARTYLFADRLAQNVATL